jgi:hypothetical protein
MMPLSASIMVTSAQQLIGVAEYKVESPMVKTSTSGKKKIHQRRVRRLTGSIFILGSASNPLQPSHNHRRQPSMTGRQAHLLPVADMTLALSLALFP